MKVKEMLDEGTLAFRFITPLVLFLLTVISTMVFNKIDFVEKQISYLVEEVNILDKRISRAEFTLYGDGITKKNFTADYKK